MKSYSLIFQKFGDTINSIFITVINRIFIDKYIQSGKRD